MGILEIEFKREYIPEECNSTFPELRNILEVLCDAKDNGFEKYDPGIFQDLLSLSNFVFFKQDEYMHDEYNYGHWEVIDWSEKLGAFLIIVYTFIIENIMDNYENIINDDWAVKAFNSWYWYIDKFDDDGLITSRLKKFAGKDIFKDLLEMAKTMNIDIKLTTTSLVVVK